MVPPARRRRPRPSPPADRPGGEARCARLSTSGPGPHGDPRLQPQRAGPRSWRLTPRHVQHAWCQPPLTQPQQSSSCRVTQMAGRPAGRPRHETRARRAARSGGARQSKRRAGVRHRGAAPGGRSRQPPRWGGSRGGSLAHSRRATGASVGDMDSVVNTRPCKCACVLNGCKYDPPRRGAGLAVGARAPCLGGRGESTNVRGPAPRPRARAGAGGRGGLQTRAWGYWRRPPARGARGRGGRAARPRAAPGRWHACGAKRDESSLAGRPRAST